MMTEKIKLTEHRGATRGKADHGWLRSRHSFSFAQYFDPQRVQFGALRVLNDDEVLPGMGFGTHPHENMEIISIPLEGSLAHRDSTGREAEIRSGEVQIMSAGSGITHSEYNHSKEQKVNFLQLWIFPREKNIKPRYAQKYFDFAARPNELVTVVAPDGDEALWINQEAWLSIGHIRAGSAVTYRLKKAGNGVYLFLINGRIVTQNLTLARRDGLGIEGAETIEISASTDAQLLVVEVPMQY